MLQTMEHSSREKECLGNFQMYKYTHTHWIYVNVLQSGLGRLLLFSLKVAFLSFLSLCVICE